MNPFDKFAQAKSLIASTPAGGSTSNVYQPMQAPVKPIVAPVVKTPAISSGLTPVNGMINGIPQAEYNRLDNLYKTPQQNIIPPAPVVTSPSPTTPTTNWQGVPVDKFGEATYNTPPLNINPMNENGAIPSTSLGSVSKADVLGTRNYLQQLQDKILGASLASGTELDAQKNVNDLKQQDLELQNKISQEADRLASSSDLTKEQATNFLTETYRRGNVAKTNLALQQSAQANVLGNEQLARQNQLEAFKTLYNINQPVSVGGNLVNPTTGEILYQGQRSPVSLSAGETLVDPITGKVIAGGATSGLLSFAEATQAGVPYGTTREQMLGITPYKTPTEAQAKASLFATRVQDSDAILKANEQSIVSQNPVLYQAQSYAEGSTLFNSLASDVVRQQRQAERNFLNSILRRESGAVISPTEFAEGAKQYFPRPGDDAKTLEQKARNREVAKQALINEAGNAYTQTQGRLGSTAGSTTIDDSFFSPANFDN